MNLAQVPRRAGRRARRGGTRRAAPWRKTGEEPDLAHDAASAIARRELDPMPPAEHITGVRLRSVS